MSLQPWERLEGNCKTKNLLSTWAGPVLIKFCIFISFLKVTSIYIVKNEYRD